MTVKFMGADRTGNRTARKTHCPYCLEEVTLKPGSLEIPSHNLRGSIQEDQRCEGSGRAANEDAVTLTGALSAIRRRARASTSPVAADVLLLCDAVENIARMADAPVMSRCMRVLPPGREHVREHWWDNCDCPGSIPLMWPLEPGRVLSSLARDIAGREETEAAQAAGTED